MVRALVVVGLLFAMGSHAATPAASAGDQHSLALHRDGSIRAWGDDTAGALGSGRSLGSLVPIVVNGLANVAAVAAGQSHTLALTTDGRVWAWGANEYGQLGDGSHTGRSTPTQVVGLSGVVEIGAGLVHSVARKADGTVWTWGGNFVGQLGDDSVVRESPAQVPGVAGVVALSSGTEHVAVLTSDGRVWAWGRNDSGQLGDGTVSAQYTGRATAAPVAGLAGVTAVAAGNFHTIARRQDGTVWAWGDNTDGSLGDGTTTSRSTPVAVQGLGTAVSISAGSYSAAIKDDGSLWAWGANGYGQIDGSYANRVQPVRLAIENVAFVAAGFIHSSAVKGDGTVWSWGSNEHGELGDGTTLHREDPVQVSGLTGVMRVAMGGGHAVALKNDGHVFVWGDNSSGQLGDGVKVFRTAPIVPNNASGFTAVAAGGRHSIALKGDGSVWAAGNNDSGQLGDGTRTVRATFAPVKDLAGIVKVAAGFWHSVAIRSDGSVWAWGAEYMGRLGAGQDFTYSLLPVQVRNLANVVSVAAGSGHTLALKSDGTVWAWGENFAGQLGDGTIVEKYEPVQVPGLTNVVEVSAGYDHSLARKSDGSVWAWGANDSGQLGDDSHIERRTPVRVNGLVNATMISAGIVMSAALTSDGGVWTWGANYDGQLGDGTNDERPFPFRLPNLPDVRSISAGGSHMLALRSDGSVFVWGRNDYGQVGDATLASRWTAVLVAREGGAGTVAGNDWFLDLDPGVAKNIPPERTPVFLVKTTGANSDVVAQIQYRQQDVGTSGSVYVFALAPPDRVVGTVASKDRRFGALEKGEKDDPVQCVLAQLNASGQLQAVSASNLQAYVTGVLSGQGQAVSVLNGASTAAASGATFFVGYGSNANAMLANGTNRGVVTVPGAMQCLPQPPQTGWWWNASQGGRGYSVEVRGNHLFYAAYLYDVSGRATWVIATGNTSLDGSLFTGDLFSFSGGQTLAGSYPGFPASRVEGQITLAFNDASHGTMVWPGGAVAIERFNIVPNGLDLAPLDTQPEGGWWWNPAESGRGFFLEWQGGELFMAGYMYDDSGNPIWYLATNTTPSSNLQSFSASWWQFANGPTLTGSYKPANRVNDNVAPVTIQFSGPETGIMTLPGGKTTPIRRFRF